MVSIKDVAKHAGVAISTVSKVLNDYPNVSEETKKKVNQAVNELNFVPNSVAAALSSKQSGRVAILLNLSSASQAVDEINMQYMSGTIGRAVELNLDVITIFYSMLQNILYLIPMQKQLFNAYLFRRHLHIICRNNFVRI